MRIKALTAASIPAEVGLLRPPEVSNREIAATVAAILADVRARGDAAVVEATARLDWKRATVEALVVSGKDLASAYEWIPGALLQALRTARDNCTFFHVHERRADWEAEGPEGQRLGVRHLPVERAGLYVPGGLGAYASTVIMNAVPALVAGVRELVICTPPGRDGIVNRSVLAAARLMGIERVFRAGGAQAVAAMAYGTETIPQVDVICGPGNRYVVEAKRQVFGQVGIDGLAGPSEVLVIADGSARPEWVAADMLAQQEHGSGAQAVLMAESLELCLEVEKAVGRLRAQRAGAAGDAAVRAARRGAGASAAASEAAVSELQAFHPAPAEDFLTLAATLADAYAPEHLELQVGDPRGFIGSVHAAGAIFLGHLTPTAFGDYVAGSNHVLPTGGSARFSSPLSVDTFVRKQTRVEMSPGAVKTLTPQLSAIADSEGFTFHRLSAELRATE